ncbi:MAG: penicillin-binding transpeptidase domain-containing protein [Planctomycetota bacterium]
MFEHRLRVLLGVVVVIFLALVARLIELQVVRADYYRDQTEKAVALKPKSLFPARGGIFDRGGEVLLHDGASWDIRVDYDAIAIEFGSDPSVLEREVRRQKPIGRYARELANEDVGRAVVSEIAQLWERIARASGREDCAAEVVRSRAQEVYERVSALRKSVAGRRGFEGPVAEERQSHALVEDLGRDQQIVAREMLADSPWVSVEASMKRAYGADCAPFVHLLGRVGRVDADDLAGDANEEDPFRRYLPDEEIGISGVERLAEESLRGRRGQIVYDRDGNVLGDVIQPENGSDVSITIHAELQRRLYRLLGERLESIPESSGGSIVVLDVASREVLALVSYPSYEPDAYEKEYGKLLDDTERLPLTFRAVASRYAPGSIVKPIVCLAALMNHRLGLDIREECKGYLLEDHPDQWRCWEIHGTNIRKSHGMVDVVEALRGSCNVFMFKIGERVGVDGLCSAFDMAGIGRTSGIGLREENMGINPTPEWLQREKKSSVYPGHARNFAIGQGEMAITPLQAANLAATYASGRYRPVTLLRDGKERPEWILPASAAQWRAIRRGIFEVVNHPDGTAYKFARWSNDRYALCGKTGSATAHPWPTKYRIRHASDSGEMTSIVIPAGNKASAIRRFELEFPGAKLDAGEVELAGTWPRNAPVDDNYSHAWFAGYLQEIDGHGEPKESVTPRVAFSVLVEFGGSGGRTSGPIAAEVAEELVRVMNLD